MRGGRLPSSTMISCSAAMRPILARASRVMPAVCGLAITLSNCNSGCSGGGGSLSQTSRPAPAIVFARFAARVDVDGIEAGAVGGDDQQIRHARQQLAPQVEARVELVA